MQLNGVTLKQLPTLEQLHMRNNKLLTISPGALDAAPLLNTIDLAHNQLGYLPSVCSSCVSPIRTLPLFRS